jgi:hypothetical protein
MLSKQGPMMLCALRAQIASVSVAIDRQFPRNVPSFAFVLRGGRVSQAADFNSFKRFATCAFLLRLTSVRIIGYAKCGGLEDPPSEATTLQHPPPSVAGVLDCP